MAAKKSPLKFEQSLQELEQLVEALEQGDLSLDQALQQFARGVALSRSCQNVLEQAEQRVEKLLHPDGKPVPVDPAELGQ